MQAAAIDRQRSADGASSLGPLAGVPVAVKVSRRPPSVWVATLSSCHAAEATTSMFACRQI